MAENKAAETNKWKHNTNGDKFFILICYLLVGVFSIICLLPMWIALVASFTNESTLIRNGYGLWTNNWDLTAYRMIFAGTSTVMKAYGVTITITALGILITVILTAMTAYPLSLKQLRYRGKLLFYIYFTTLFNGGLVANYIMISQFLKMRNTIGVLIIPGCLSAYNFFLMCNYFKSLPEAIIESGKIDGANDMTIFWKIVLPISKPIIATITLFAGMGYWNEWYKALLYIDNPDLYPLQYLIMKLQNQLDFLTSSLGAKALASLGNVPLPSITIRMATVMVTIGPIIFLYPLLQKYFIKGIIIGSIKG